MTDHSAIQLGGYLLWRTGLVIAGAGSLYSAARWILAFWILPTAVTTGIALIVSGLGLVMVSLLLERRADSVLP